MAIVLVEQYLDFALARADSYVALKRGAVTMAGRTTEADLSNLRAAVSV